MTLLLVCLATVLCLTPASVLSDSKAAECREKCLPFHDSGFVCALRNRCTPPLVDAAKEACYARCMLLYHNCPSACEEHDDRITAMCQAQCSGARPPCEDECFYSKMEEILLNPAKREGSIQQPVPVLGRQSREALYDWDEYDSKRSWDSWPSEDVDNIFGIWRKKRDTKRSPGGTSSMDMDIFEEWANKRDSKRSWDSWPSEDVDNMFGIWRKKRDTKRSPGGTSSMDMDIFEEWANKRDTKRSPGGTSSMDMDIFEEWANKRDSKRSPGSSSSMDMGDIFGIQRRGQDWSWEEGKSDTEVYGDWRDKRQAETEIQ